MSINFKTKEVFYIDDTRQLNYLECMGLIQNSITFNLIEPIEKVEDSVSEVKMFMILMGGYFNSYVLRCDPKYKMAIIEFKTDISPDYNYVIKFVPCNENLKIDYINNEGIRFATSTYSAEELMDMFI